MKKEENDSKSNSNQSNMEEKKNQMNITPNVQIARALQEHEDEASKILINNFDEIVTLNKYLYDGHTVPKIVELFAKDLRAKSIAENDNVDLAMSSFFMAYNALFLNSKSITNQSERLLDFYKRIVSATPEYTYAFSGRLKAFIERTSSIADILKNMLRIITNLIIAFLQMSKLICILQEDSAI